MYTAMHMAGSEDVAGFTSEDAAWEWIKNNRLCHMCLKELADGGCWCGFGDIEEWHETTDPAFTPCGGEWIVEKEYFCN
jgi:hypothetical protein